MSQRYFAPYGRAPVHYPLESTQRTGVALADTELIIVEGDSAAKSVNQVRDATRQSVLALQGKPMNVGKACHSVLLKNDILRRFACTLLGRKITPIEDWSVPLAQAESCRYGRVAILMDPDADGIHCGVLALGILLRFTPELLRQGRVSVVRPPMILFRVETASEENPVRTFVASNPEHAKRVEQKLREAGVQRFERFRHRGLGSIPSEILRHHCVQPNTRAADVMSFEEAQTAVAMFGGR
ncbi:toprim domain-containing protein [Rhodopirellula halodulae]|uniref:toprim domain-containing protein n=1 Tax=Rhodopirellula halodulae TaxID=2894198 RepID=UPI001E3399F0|nr:toprim domain-containing protein [Rhodopirellula sp. JC737]MCC9658611.1 toprim domain-containing protein [Rhodopirellula sp. JC737]